MSHTSTTLARSRRLRSAATDAEQVLWRHLRNRQLEGFKFRRQHPVRGYYLDMACVEVGLCVEIDGAQHLEPHHLQADERRSVALQEAGFRVLRFDNRQVLTQTQAVLTVIRKALLDANRARVGAHPHPSPLPQAGEGDGQCRVGPGPHASPLPQARQEPLPKGNRLQRAPGPPPGIHLEGI